MNEETRARESVGGQAKLAPITDAEEDRDRAKKERCQQLYAELMEEVEDLGSITFRTLWFARAKVLKDVGCWWHYSLAIKKGRDYLKSIR